MTATTIIYPRPGLLRRLTALLMGALSDSAPASLSRQEFRAIIDSYGPMISRLCYAYASSREDFDDLRQDAIVNIWRGMGSYRGDADLRTWIYRVTLNTCVSTLRRRARRSDTVPLDRIADMADDSTPAESAERIALLHRLIGRLHDDDRAMILMWLDERPYDEIAATMGLPRNTVATRLRRIKDKLSKMTPDQ